MAGICGLIGLSGLPVEGSHLESMAGRMAHRGAQVGRLRWREVRFAALGTGTPPVWPPPGRESASEVCVALDGTIDNARELSLELTRTGSPPPANDAHLVGLGFRAYGDSFLKKIQGPYAVAVHDPESTTTWIARDPMGMRPLYIQRSRGRIAFASEIRPLLSDAGVRADLDAEQLRVLLSLGYVPSPQTLLKGIHKMPPGHLVRVDQRGPKSIVHDSPPSEAADPPAFDEAVEKYRASLQRVARRIAGEDAGILLSGGSDSAALLLLRTRDQTVAKTYTLGTPDLGDEGDERLAAWQAARALGTVHREGAIESDAIGALFQVLAGVADEPVAGPWMPPFMRLLDLPAGQVSTVWSGMGVEALHGFGEPWRWLRYGEWVDGLPPKVGGLLGGVARRFGGVARSTEKSRLLAIREEGERVLESFLLFPDDELDRLLRPSHLGDRQTARKLLSRWTEPVADLDPLAQGLYLYRRTYLADAVFLPAAALAERQRLTIRFPFADEEIVRWMEALPSSYRLDAGGGRRLHSEALAAWLPAEVLARPKRKLDEAVRHWLVVGGSSRVHDWLLGSSAWTPAMLDSGHVRGLIDRTCRGKAPIDPLVLLIQLELWGRETFLGGV